MNLLIDEVDRLYAAVRSLVDTEAAYDAVTMTPHNVLSRDPHELFARIDETQAAFREARAVLVRMVDA